ncbi:MAG: hypothetical protein M1322_01020 [Candidatus Parvarchaeota archaeon]|nr:hypothetical protein [Candidatus Parvarchaeota archaeon]MCL5106688.1 hypothetical protein [Candidatus Parvarchaeota archaeon]
MEKPIMLVITAVIAVVAILIVVAFATHVLKPASVSVPSSFSNLTSGTSMFAASSNLYNAATSFNESYNFYFSPSPTGVSNLSMVNGTFWIAKYNNLFRGSLEYETSLPSISSKVTASLIYNGSEIIVCNKQIFVNDTPLNSTMAASLASINSRPTVCNTSSLNGATPFDVAASFAVAPFSALSPNSNYSSFVKSFANSTIKFLGIKTYLGENCYLEELTPKVNPASGLSFFDCVSAKNGLPLSITFEINNSVALKSSLSAINSAPTSQAVITNLPLNATLGS